MVAHEIEYEIIGSEMQAVEVILDPDETTVSEPGSMLYMEEGISMETMLGDGSKANQGFFGKVLDAGKRAITGEKLFMTSFTNQGAGKKKVAFASPYPGKIIPIDLAEKGEIQCQKGSFLCSAKGISVGIAFQKKLGVGFFGGEGFIMQRLTGNGLAFVHAGGSIIERQLEPGETLKVDTGCLVALTSSINYDIKFVGGIKNTLFGGEGMFFAVLSGPGTVWLQTLPFSRLADKILALAPKKSKSEGGGFGDGMDGDDE